MGSCKRSQPREPRREGRQKEGAAHGHWGMRNARNVEKQTKSDHVNRIKSDQIKPNQTKSDQIKPNQTKSNQIKPNQTKSNQIKPNQTKSDQKNGPARIKAPAVGSKRARAKLDLG